MLFDNGITTEFEAYLAGFLYADGYVDKRNSLIINLAIVDEGFLQNLCDILNKELNKIYKLKYIESQNSVRLSIYCRKFVQNLQNIGIRNRKTYDNDSSIFDNIKNKILKIHFIRGFYDGDGGIHINKVGKVQISIVSLNQKLLDSILNFIKTECMIKTKANLTKTHVYALQLQGNVVVKSFLDLLYTNSTIYLSRKYNVYTEIRIYKDICSSKYKNIHQMQSGKWRVTKSINGVKRHFGVFDSEENAYACYVKLIVTGVIENDN